MKKKVIYLSVLTALLSASSIALAGGPEIIVPEPDYFDGFYVGGMGGVHHNTFHTSSQINLTQPIAIFNIVPLTLLQAGTLNSSNYSSGEFDGYGGVQGGFGKTFGHRFYAGVVGWGDWGSSSNTQSQTASIPFTPVNRTFAFTGQIGPINISNIVNISSNRSASATTSSNMKISNDYGVAAKLGWVVAPRSMIYGKIGASWANISVSNNLNTNSSSNFSYNRLIQASIEGGAPQTIANIAFNRSTATSLGANSSASGTKQGLLLGAGFEQFVYERMVSLFAEYDYTNYGHVSSPPAYLNGNRTTNNSFVITNGDGTVIVNNQTNTNNAVNTNVTTQASTTAQVSMLMAGLNFYFHI